MKVIVSGSTGLIGGGTLRAFLKLPSVTSVVALSRRPVEIKDPKLNNVIIKDFSKYDQSTIDQLEGAEACVWALGTPMGGADVHDIFTFAAADAFAEHLLPILRKDGKVFRFIYTSGGLVETNPDANLWYLSATRKMRGNVENKIRDYQTKQTGWETFVVRPLAVTNGSPWWKMIAPSMYIPIEELGAAMANLAVSGGGVQILENAALRERAAKAT